MCTDYSSCFALRTADIASHLLAWKYVKGVNMDLCRGEAAPSKHHTPMPVVEFNKLERWKLMKGKHEKGVGRREWVGEWAREGANQWVSEQGRNTEDGRCCLVWSNQATGYNSSQYREMKGISIWRMCGLTEHPEHVWAFVCVCEWVYGCQCAMFWCQACPCISIQWYHKNIPTALSGAHYWCFLQGPMGAVHYVPIKPP